MTALILGSVNVSTARQLPPSIPASNVPAHAEIVVIGARCGAVAANGFEGFDLSKSKVEERA